MWSTIARRFLTPSREAATFQFFPPDEKLSAPSIFAAPSEARSEDDCSSKSTFHSAKSGTHETKTIAMAVLRKLFIIPNQTAEVRACQIKDLRRFYFLRLSEASPARNPTVAFFLFPYNRPIGKLPPKLLPQRFFAYRALRGSVCRQIRRQFFGLSTRSPPFYFASANGILENASLRILTASHVWPPLSPPQPFPVCFSPRVTYRMLFFFRMQFSLHIFDKYFPQCAFVECVAIRCRYRRYMAAANSLSAKYDLIQMV